jgi:hypothetical protein
MLSPEVPRRNQGVFHVHVPMYITTQYTMKKKSVFRLSIKKKPLRT